MSSLVIPKKSITIMKEPFDNSTKAFYRQLFEQWGIAVETEREVFSRGRTIDLVVTCTDSDQARLQTTVFAHFKRLNAIELKGINDPLTEIDYNRIMMRSWGLGALKPEKTIEESEENTDSDETLNEGTGVNQLDRRPSQRTITIICLTKPVKILNQLQHEYQFVKTEEDGIYHCQAGLLSQWIICPSELALIPKNYPLLPLARGDKLEQFTSLCFEQRLFDYLNLIMDIGRYTDPNVILQKLLEVQNMKPQIREETWAYVDKFFREKPDALWKIPVFRDALVDSQKRAEQQGVQQTLLRQLRRKFVSIPDSAVHKIEATSDIQQLDTWLDQTIVANSLADIGFMSPEPKQK